MNCLEQRVQEFARLQKAVEGFAKDLNIQSFQQVVIGITRHFQTISKNIKLIESQFKKLGEESIAKKIREI
jgi:hypothetical protein